MSLIIGIDEPHQVAQHDAVFVTQPGAWQQHGREAVIGDMDGDARWYQMGCTRGDGQRLLETGAQIHAGGTFGGEFGQGKFTADARVEDFELYFLHGTGWRYVV